MQGSGLSATVLLCVVTLVWTPAVVLAASQAQEVFRELLDANKFLLDNNQGEMVALLTEHILPKTTDEKAIRARVDRRLDQFRELQQKNPQSEKTRFDLELAIPFNARYDLMNESTTKSRITYRWQGDKYYYDMEVLDRQDSIKPSKELRELGTTHVFMTKWNGQRIFTFDNDKAVNYFKPAHAVHIQRGRLRLQNPRAWGIPAVMGQLANSQTLNGYNWSTQPVKINDKPHQELLGEGPEGQWIRIIYDPGFETRPLHVEYQGQYSAAAAHYGNYEQIDDQWFPKKMFLQSYKIEVNPDTGQTSRKLYKEITWEIERADPAPTFGPDSFKAGLQPGDRVTDFRYNPPFQYVHADPEIEQAVIDELASIKFEYHQELASVDRPDSPVPAPPSKFKTATTPTLLTVNKQASGNSAAHARQTEAAASVKTSVAENSLARSVVWPTVMLVALGTGGILLEQYHRRKRCRT